MSSNGKNDNNKRLTSDSKPARALPARTGENIATRPSSQAPHARLDA
ncbi:MULTISPECIES: hypothetical protein [unclassified Paraburkholderia]|nr:MULTISPECIES: hypothetical protein [unclassified Paraburkholderia]